MGCTLAPPGEYDWTVHVRWWCSLMSNYFDHLFFCFWLEDVCIVYAYSGLASHADDDIRALNAMVHLTCSKRSVKLPKGAKRKAWCPTVAECMNSFVIVVQVATHHRCRLLLLLFVYDWLCGLYWQLKEHSHNVSHLNWTGQWTLSSSVEMSDVNAP